MGATLIDEVLDFYNTSYSYKSRTHAMMVARYIPGIMPVNYGDVEPEGAIKQIEG
jgi:hypothetical protein